MLYETLLSIIDDQSHTFTVSVYVCVIFTILCHI